MNPNFLCKCGHRNKMHISLEEALKYNPNGYRLCIEYEDSVCIKNIWYHNCEDICHCGNFVGDNLLTLEYASEKMV